MFWFQVRASLGSSEQGKGKRWRAAQCAAAQRQACSMTVAGSAAGVSLSLIRAAHRHIGHGDEGGGARLSQAVALQKCRAGTAGNDACQTAAIATSQESGVPGAQAQAAPKSACRPARSAGLHRAALACATQHWLACPRSPAQTPVGPLACTTRQHMVTLRKSSTWRASGAPPARNTGRVRGSAVAQYSGLWWMHCGQRGPRREPTGAPTASQTAQPRPAASCSSPDTTRRTRPPSRSLILENTILSKMGVACRGRVGSRDREMDQGLELERKRQGVQSCREWVWPAGGGWRGRARHTREPATCAGLGHCCAARCSVRAPCSSHSRTAGMDAYLQRTPTHLVMRVALGQHVQLAAVAPVEQRLLHEGAFRHLARQGTVDTRQKHVSAGVLADADNGAQHSVESCSGWAPLPPGHATNACRAAGDRTCRYTVERCSSSARSTTAQKQ